MKKPVTPADYHVENLIIGSGVAGLTLALKLAEFSRVLVVAKGNLVENNSYYAQGGVASVLSPNDSFDKHINDTLVAGAGLCHENVVREVVEAGPQAIKELIDFGVAFTKHKEDEYHLTKEGGHSARRVIHADDITGQAMVNALISQAKNHKNIEIREHQIAIDLVVTDKTKPSFSANACYGAFLLDEKTSMVYSIKSKRTYLCTGGHGRLYLITSNPNNATGDGLAMGWRAGCKVANLEFMQFHPTCLYHHEEKTFLISEAVRGEGAVLKDIKGREFMTDYHELGSLAPRDIVARAIDNELKKSGASHVYLDIKKIGVERFKNHFPNIFQTCVRLGIDLDSHLIPVVPAAHYSCGGLVTDDCGRTSVRNLYALGEVACSGLHGANRLASNSLLEALVFADRAAKASRTDAIIEVAEAVPQWKSGNAIPPDEQVILSHTWDEVRRLMWHYVGIVRSDRRLRRARKRITAILLELDKYYWNYQINNNLLEVRNLALIAHLTIKCAMSRKESRGIHYNIDYPDLDEEPRDSIVR